MNRSLPSGLSASEYARQFEDPAAAFGALIRKAEWVGKGKRQAPSVPAMSKDFAPAPVLATVEVLSSGDSLSIGLGRAESVLNFVSGSGDPPYWVCVGEHEEDEAVSCNFLGELSEIPLRHLIPIGLARQAMRDFVRTEKLSPNVNWEES